MKLPLISDVRWVYGNYPYSYNLLPSSLPPKFFGLIGVLITLATSALMISAFGSLLMINHFMMGEAPAYENQYVVMGIICSVLFTIFVGVIYFIKHLLGRTINQDEYLWLVGAHKTLNAPEPSESMRKFELGRYVTAGYRSISERGRCDELNELMRC